MPCMVKGKDGATQKTILFLCTGNYYRSRFAEIYFNALAEAHGLPWRAESRGLQLNPNNAGSISRQTTAWLQRLEIITPTNQRPPIQVCESDFQVADLIVALKEAEHRSLVELHFPFCTNKVQYWNI